jgi:hypothetical protein
MKVNVALILVLASLAVVATLAADCNGNGHRFSDTNQCECYQCYSGSQCEQVIPSCTIQVISGNPEVYAHYWDQVNATTSEATTVTPCNYRTTYQSGSTLIPPKPQPGSKSNSKSLFLFYSFNRSTDSCLRLFGS